MTQQGSDQSTRANPTNVERKGDRELVVTRLFDAPPRIVFPSFFFRERVECV